MPRTILVTGATGNVGRHVVAGLLNAGVNIRALTRSPTKTQFPQDVNVVRGDLSDPTAIAEYVQGVDAVFLLCRTAPAAGLIDMIARHAGRIVLLSSSAIRDGVDQQSNPIARMHADIERLIEESGVEWTFLRPGAFAANAMQWWAPQIRSGDVVRWPYGSAATAPIHERDIASVAVEALLSDTHKHAKLTLTGPHSLTQREQVRIIGEAIGRPLQFEEISPTDARQQMQTRMPSFVVDMLLDVWAQAVDKPAAIAGASVRTFEEWARDHARDFQPSTSTWPNVARLDVGAIMLSEWAVGTVERQQGTADAFVLAWQGEPWPDGLLSVNIFGSTDGETISIYAQWTNTESYQKFSVDQRLARAAKIDVAVLGITRTPAVEYKLYRSGTRDPAPVPGCLVMVSVEFDGPDEARQRRWIDTVFEALKGESELPKGGISGHFHISTDGTRVLNYAEWTTAEAHREAIEGSTQGAIGSSPKWRDVHSFTGVNSSGFKRYRLLKSLLRTA